MGLRNAAFYMITLHLTDFCSSVTGIYTSTILCFVHEEDS